MCDCPFCGSPYVLALWRAGRQRGSRMRCVGCGRSWLRHEVNNDGEEAASHPLYRSTIPVRPTG